MSSASRTTTSILVALAAAAVASLVIACSSDAGKPAGSGVTGSVVPDAGEEAGADASSDAAVEAGSGLKKNAEQGCTKDTECESNHCFVGGNQSFCSVSCTVATQATICVPPFTGTCNKQGFCKRD